MARIILMSKPLTVLEIISIPFITIFCLLFTPVMFYRTMKASFVSTKIVLTDHSRARVTDILESYGIDKSWFYDAAYEHYTNEDRYVTYTTKRFEIRCVTLVFKDKEHAAMFELKLGVENLINELNDNRIYIMSENVA